MPDISMCQNKDCKSHEKCYRFMAKPNQHRQAYMDFKPDDNDDKCDDYLPLYVRSIPSGVGDV